MSCDNLCTAAKCQELENRIGALEQALELLEASFEAHTNQDIPTAHDYDSNIKIDGLFESNRLNLTVADKISQDTASILIPDSDVAVSLATNSSDNTLKVFVKVGSKSDNETVTLPQGDVTVSLATNSSDNTLKVFVKVGSKSDDETVTLPKENPFDWLDLLGDLLKTLLIKDVIDATKDLIRDAIDKAIEELLRGTFLNISSDYSNQNLQICVSNSFGSDCTSVRIPRRGGGGGNGEDDTSEYLNGSGNLSDEGILQILINSSIGNANIEIDMGLTELKEMIKKIHEYTVVDIAGTTPTEFLCSEKSEEETENSEKETKKTNLTYGGKGIAGLHGLTKTFNDNLLTVFSEICQFEPVPTDTIPAIPEWWQVRVGSDRPQLVVIFKGGDSYWSMALPWYKGKFKDKTIELIPSYKRGNFSTILTLNDNSKIVVNALSKIEGENFMKKIKKVIKPKLLEGAELKSGGERKGKELSKGTVTPAYAKYFATGQQNLLPNWRYNFKTKKFIKYVSAE